MSNSILAFTLSILCVPMICHAEQTLELAVPFTDNMILQREADVPVWGFDLPGSKITVEFAGQKKTTVADHFGDWMIKLDPLQASHEERQFTVVNNRGVKVILRHVLVGEVWFSSGQSNMVWVANSSMCRDIARDLSSSPKGYSHS